MRGELRAIRIGRTVRIRRADFEDMLERARIAPAICIRPGDAGSSPNRAFRRGPSRPRATSTGCRPANSRRVARAVAPGGERSFA